MYSAASFGVFQSSVPPGPARPEVPTMDLNGSAPTSPQLGGAFSIQNRASSAFTTSPQHRPSAQALPRNASNPAPHIPQAVRQGPNAPSSATSSHRAPGGRQSDPHFVSSDTSATRTKRATFGSTGLRRKSSGAIKMVADATLEGSEKLLKRQKR
jgi:hypothetical protein